MTRSAFYLVALWLTTSVSLAGSDWAYADYLPMSYLTSSRSAQEMSSASKLVFYDYLPSELNGKKARHLEIRSANSGGIKVVESAQFGISVNVSAKNTFDLAGINIQYTAVEDTIILQVMNEEPVLAVGLSSLAKLAIAGGAVLILSVIVAAGFICFWMTKFEKKEEEPDLDQKDDAISTYSESFTLSEKEIDCDSLLLNSWEAHEWMKEAELAALEAEQQSYQSNSTQRNHKPAMGNGNLLVKQKSVSRDSTDSTRPSFRKHRQRAPAQRSRDISSSEDVSSLDDNWSKRKASWRKAHSAHVTIPENTELSSKDLSRGDVEVKVVVKSARRTQFSDYEVTSGDVGFSSGNEYASRHRRRGRSSKGTSLQNSSLDEMQWDEYDTEEAKLPTIYTRHNGWQMSSNDEANEDIQWPPPLVSSLQEEVAESSDKDAATGGNLSDVREAITSAMDSVNSDMAAAGGVKSKKSESLQDDGYETGAALNGVHNPANANQTASSPSPRSIASPPSPSKKGRGGKPSTNNLSVTVLASLTVLSIIGGVCGFSYNLTTTEFVIFVPNHYFESISMYANNTDQVYIDIEEKPADTKVHLFAATDPLLEDLQANKCGTVSSKKCEHGCNRKTGTCVCSKGYLVLEGNRCTDVNDCLYLPCPSDEDCKNTLGGFICSCPKGYTRGDTGSCIECSKHKCPAGQYEAKPCPDKSCSPCNTSCPPEHYMTLPCSEKSDLQCVMCSPACNDDEYELKPCTSDTNRKCEKKSQLPAPIGSENLILEPKSNRRTAESLERHLDKPQERVEFPTELVRGSNIVIKISVKSVNLFPALRPIVHTDSNDDEQFIANDGPPYVLTQYCPHPMPVKYELLPVPHNDVTAAKKPNCPDCPIDPRQPCQTYKVFGKPAPLEPFDRSLVCTEPNELAEMFDLNNFLTESRSIVVQSTQACEIINDACDSCSGECADSIIKQKDGNCTITADDDANSWSPRLMHCQNCCLNTECSDMCAAVQQCMPTSCWKGNVAEFLLSPSFPQGKMEYYCHVGLDESIQMLALDYTVMYNGTALKNFSMTLLQNEASVTQTSYSDGLLTVRYSTGIDTIPDMIHGTFKMDDFTPNYDSGLYSPSGESVSRMSPSRRDVVPRRPFEFSTKWWKEQNCSKLIADSFVFNNGTIFKKQPDVTVSKNAMYTYNLWNRTSQPNIKFELPASVSVIEKLFPPTEVELRSIRATVNRYSSGWRIFVSGQTVKCPGYFTLRIWEVNRQTPLSEQEVAVRPLGYTCQSQFSISFDVAGADVSKVTRQFRIEFSYADGRRHFIQAESQPPKGPSVSIGHQDEEIDQSTAAFPLPEPVMAYPRNTDRTPIDVMGPFLLVIGVAIAVLSLAWIASVAVPKNLGPVTSKPLTRGLILIGYVLFRVCYMFASSFVVFGYIWLVLNGPDLVVIQSYTSAVDTILSQQQYDLRSLISYSNRKMRSQQEEFQAMSSSCFTNIKSLQEQSQKMMQRLSNEMNKELSSLPIRNELLISMEQRVKELRDKLERHRTEYNNFARVASNKLLFEISKTIEDYERTDWLAAARKIRERVLNKRPTRASTETGFQKWIGLQTQLQAMTASFEMSPLPSIDSENLTLPTLPEPPQYRNIDLLSVFLPTHDLYPEVKEPLVDRADAMRQKGRDKSVSRVSLTSLLVIFLILDLLILLVRLAGTADTCQQVLDGYSVVKTYDEKYHDGCSSQKYLTQKITKKNSRVKYKLFKLILETDFVPLSVALLVILGVSYVALHIGLNFISLDSLTKLGLFSSLIGPWNLTSSIALDNVQINTQKINNIDIPSTQLLLNHYIERIEMLNNAYNKFSYHKWQIECGDSPSPRCGEFNTAYLVQPLDIKDVDCVLKPLPDESSSELPIIMTDRHAREVLLPYIESFRYVVESTVSQLLQYTTFILLYKMLAIVFWNFLTRLSIIPGVREVITNEMAIEDLPQEELVTHIKAADPLEDISDEESLGSLPEIDLEDLPELPDLSELPSLNLSEQDHEEMDREFNTGHGM